MHVLYNALIIVALPVLLFYVVYRWLRGKSREGWAERMGYLPVSSGEHPVWVHAVSAGEAVAAEAVVRALHERLPGVPILYTAGTPEGRATAVKRMGSILAHVSYAPYDLPLAVARAMDRVRPRLYILVESDLWPNLLQAAAERGVPAMLTNGYISERTLRRGRLVPALYRWIFSNLCSICVQTDAVRRRALALHAVPERVRVVGNVKYDQATAPLTEEQVARWRALFRFEPHEPVLVAGSTHPGEEAKVLEAYAAMRTGGVAPRLILAPRHPQRADEVEALVRAAGLRCVRRSRLGEGDGNAECGVRIAECKDAVILLDTMGELAGVFSLATVVFLGGSLVPVGGHDILQPLIAGKPVLLGPYTHRQREIVEEALDAGVVWEVDNPQELARRAVEMMRDAAAGDDYGANAVTFVASRRGASQRCAEEAARLLDAQPAPRAKCRLPNGDRPVCSPHSEIGNPHSVVRIPFFGPYLLRVAEGEVSGPIAVVIRAGLRAFSWLYLAAVDGSVTAHRSGVLRCERAPCPVIGVGNLTVGGTGKSTATAEFARWLLDAGLRPAVLSRGYGAQGSPPVRVVSDGTQVLLGPGEGGDEPVMLARHLAGVPVLIGRRRPHTARAAIERFGAGVCLLDDGFQVRNLRKDLEIVLLDSRRPFDNGFVLPRGMLREPPSHLGRADAVVLMEPERVEPEALTELRDRVQALAPRALVAEACRVPERLWELDTGREFAIAALEGLPVVALSAIGNPQGFEALLGSLGAQVHPARLPDHHPYAPRDVEWAQRQAASSGAAAILITEKDAVKLDECGILRMEGGSPSGDECRTEAGVWGVPRDAARAADPVIPAAAGGKVPMLVLSVRLRFSVGGDALRERVLAVAKEAA